MSSLQRRLRFQLSWAAADQYAQSYDAISVHACHPGELATLEMQELNLSDGLYTPAQAAAVPSFLAADQRLDSIGTGPYYWSSRMRLKECDYMVSPLNKSVGGGLWEFEDV